MSLSKFESMLKTNSVYFFDATEFEVIIQHYLSISKISLAKKGIQLGLEQHPSSIVLKLLKIELLVFEDDLNNAIDLLSEVEAIAPNNDEVLIQKGTIASKKGMHKEAIVFLKKGLEFAEDPFDIWIMLGMEYLYLEDYKNASSNFKKCLDVDKEDYSSLYNLIYCFEMLNDFTEAIVYLKYYLDKNPYSEVGWHQLGRQYFEIADYKKALEAFDYAVLIDESFIGGYLEKGKSLEKLKEYEEAIANYLVTLKLDDPTAFVYLRIGKCYQKLGALETAIQYYKKAVHEDPFLESGWVLLSDIYNEVENYQKGIYYINKAIEIDESNGTFWLKLAELNVNLHFYEEAVGSYRRCLELGDVVIGVYISMVDLLIFMGDFEAALDVLLEAGELYNGFAEVEYRFFVLYYVLDKKIYSYIHLQKGLTIDFEYKEVVKDLVIAVFEAEEIKTIISDFKRVLK